MTSDEHSVINQALQSLPSAPAGATSASRLRVESWYRSNSDRVFWTQLETELGGLFIAANKIGLIQISFEESERHFIATLDPTAQLIMDSDEIQPYQRQLGQYFAGDRAEFSLPADISRLTDFQQRVLRAIEAIPAGTVRSYGQIAAQVGSPGGARAVGQALGNNPIPIVLPCHRVVASDGSLGGYSGGLERKRRLLSLEGALPLN